MALLLPPEVSEVLTIIAAVLVVAVYVWEFRDLFFRPSFKISFPSGTELRDHTNEEVAFEERDLVTPRKYRLDVRFLRARVTNEGRAIAQDCEAFLRLPKATPVFEVLNWRHWPRNREWMYGNPPSSKTDYLRNIQYEYLTDRKTSLSINVPRYIDLFLVMSDNSAWVLGERQAVITLPFEDEGELTLSWSGAWRNYTRKIRVKITSWDSAVFEVLDC